jgi:hypothetical protein
VERGCRRGGQGRTFLWCLRKLWGRDDALNRVMDLR